MSHQPNSIWPMVTIPVDGEPTTVRLDGFRGVAWLYSLVEKGATHEQLKDIRDALAGRELDPNSLNQAPLFGPLASLGIIPEEDFSDIIEKCFVDFDESKKDIIHKNDPRGITVTPVDKRSPGLRVIDDLEATGLLLPEHKQAIDIKINAYVNYKAGQVRTALRPLGRFAAP